MDATKSEPVLTNGNGTNGNGNGAHHQATALLDITPVNENNTATVEIPPAICTPTPASNHRSSRPEPNSD